MERTSPRLEFPDQFGDDFTLEAVSRWAEQSFAADEDFEPIVERLDTLIYAILEGWCPSRIVKNELDHLTDVLSSYHLAKYPAATRQTINDAEADLATWQTLSPAARDVIWKADEQAEADLVARQKARQVAIARKNAIYAAARKNGMPFSPALEDALAWVA